MQPNQRPAGKGRNWKDVNLIISSISVALSLGLWSLWSSREPTASAKETEAPPEPTELATETPAPGLLPGQVLVLSTSTMQASSPVADQQQPRRRKGDGAGGGGGGGGGGGNASTGSS